MTRGSVVGAVLFLTTLLAAGVESSFGAGNVMYSVQVYTSKQRRYAVQFLKHLKEEGKLKFFIYRTDSGYWTVRVYLLPKAREAFRKLGEVRKLAGVKSASVVETDVTKLSSNSLFFFYCKKRTTESQAGVFLPLPAERFKGVKERKTLSRKLRAGGPCRFQQRPLLQSRFRQQAEPKG